MVLGIIKGKWRYNDFDKNLTVFTMQDNIKNMMMFLNGLSYSQHNM